VQRLIDDALRLVLQAFNILFVERDAPGLLAQD
jgi:hypothetical protein